MTCNRFKFSETYCIDVLGCVSTIFIEVELYVSLEVLNSPFEPIIFDAIL